MNHFTITDEPKTTITRALSHSVDKCWPVMRIFDSLPGVPKEAFSIINDKKADEIGCIRNIFMGPDSYVKETLLLLSDTNHALAYNIIEKTILPGVSDYCAKYQLFAISENSCFMTWSAYWNQEGDCTANIQFVSKLFASVMETLDKTVQ